MLLLTNLAVLLMASLVGAQNTSSELEGILARRQADMAQFPTTAAFASVPTWLSSQGDNGTWADVDYRLGCDAQRANWPIQQHWIRVITLASAWSGLNPASTEHKGDADMLAGALKGMDWWFERDFTEPGCVAQGGAAGGPCPCGTPGTWNTNWFGQMILIPQLVSTACLLVKPADLTDAQKKGCDTIPRRAHDLRDANITGIGFMTGANAVNVAQNSASLALFVNDPAMLSDSLNRAWNAVTFTDTPGADGIHRDGSFLQHEGILYTGNYGKDLLNAFIQLEGEAIGTSFAANDSVREAFSTMVRGSEWMIYTDGETKQQHWDFNVIGRFVAFPRADLQASADINFNVTKMAAATADFVGANNLNATLDRLASNGTSKLIGNKAFWASDYMVHRRDKYILANKMISTRSTNSEWANSANPWGYHLGQGTFFAYGTGTEYADIQAAWDWYLIPGTTALLHAPPLNSSDVATRGKKDYVGVVSDGWVGASAMDYTDPHDGSLSFRKAWFFLEDSVLITTTAVNVDRTVAGVDDAPVISVLDQRAADTTTAKVDGKDVASSTGTLTGRTLHYGGKGYLAHTAPFNLTLSTGPRTGNWSAISTSAAGNQTTNIFAAYATIPPTTYTYEFFPSIKPKALAAQAKAPSTTPIDVGGTLGAAGAGRLALAFWPGSPATVAVPQSTIGWSTKGDFKVTTSSPVLVLFNTASSAPSGHASRWIKDRTMSVNIAEPTQTLERVEVTISATDGAEFECGGIEGCKAVDGGVEIVWKKGDGAIKLGFAGW